MNCRISVEKIFRLTSSNRLFLLEKNRNKFGTFWMENFLFSNVPPFEVIVRVAWCEKNCILVMTDDIDISRNISTIVLD